MYQKIPVLLFLTYDWVGSLHSSPLRSPTTQCPSQGWTGDVDIGFRRSGAAISYFSLVSFYCCCGKVEKLQLENFEES